jgi:hypothetical protein
MGNFSRRIILFLLTAFGLLGCGGGPTRDNYDNVNTGMTESDVERLLGTPQFSKTTDGVLVEAWKMQESDQAIMVSFQDGKATVKITVPASSLFQ